MQKNGEEVIMKPITSSDLDLYIDKVNRILKQIEEFHEDYIGECDLEIENLHSDAWVIYDVLASMREDKLGSLLDALQELLKGRVVKWEKIK